MCSHSTSTPRHTGQQRKSPEDNAVKYVGIDRVSYDAVQQDRYRLPTNASRLSSTSSVRTKRCKMEGARDAARVNGHYFGDVQCLLSHMPLVLLPHLSCLVNSLVASRPGRFLLDLQVIRQQSTPFSMANEPSTNASVTHVCQNYRLERW